MIFQHAQRGDVNPTAAGRPGPTGVSGASLWYKIGQKVHRIKDELANLKSHKIITSWFSIACQSSQTTGMQRWKSITKNYFGWVGVENYARDAGFSQQSRWKGAVLCKTKLTHVSKTKTLLVLSVNSGGMRKLIFYLLLALLSGCWGQGSTPRVSPRSTCSYVEKFRRNFSSTMTMCETLCYSFIKLFEEEAFVTNGSVLFDYEISWSRIVILDWLSKYKWVLLASPPTLSGDPGVCNHSLFCSHDDVPENL